MITKSVFALRSPSSAARGPDSGKPAAARARALVFLLAVSALTGTSFAQSPAPSATSNDYVRPSLAVPTAPPTGAMTISAGVSAPSGYVLSANDQVAVEVFGEEELRTNARLGADGNLSLPLLGSVRLGGLSLSQATARLTELYGRDYLVNPKVNVSLASYAKRRFTVLGQVSRPGSFEMPEGSPNGIDLLEAIAIAGGYTRIAAPERISVRRKGAGGDEVLRVNGKKIAKGSGTSAGFRVEPGDTITVGESIF